MNWTRRVIFLIPVVWALLMPLDGAAQSRQLVNVQSPDSISTQAGGVASVMLRLVSADATPHRIRMDARLPDRWSLLLPIPALDIPATGVARQLVSIQIPSTASSGMHSLTFRIRDEAAGREQDVHVGVQVAARYALTVEALSVPDRVRAGMSFDATFSVENNGNAESDMALTPASSLGFIVGVRPATLRLAAGARAEVRVSVQTRDDLVNEVTHVTGLTVSGASGASARSSATTQLIPVRRSRGVRAEGRIPGRLTMRGMTEDGTGPQGQVEMEIPATRIGSRVISALVRVPDVRSSSSYGSRDEYALTLEQTRTGLRLGDQAYAVSDLLDAASQGFGAEASYTRRRLETLAFVSRTRHVFPATERAGARIAVRPSPTTSLELNGLVRGQFEPGEAVSIAGAWEPLVGTALRAELASGTYRTGTGRAVLLTASGGRSRSSFTLRAEHAGPDFLGGIQNSDRLQAGFSVVKGSWFRIQGQGTAARRYFDRPGSVRAVLDTRVARLGMGGSWTIGVRRIQAMAFLQQQERVLDETGLDRSEQRGTLRLGFNQRGLGLNVSMEAGRIDDPAFAEDTFAAVQGSLFRVMGSWTLSVNGSLNDGPTFYSPVSQQRATYGTSVSYDAGRSLRANVSAFRSSETALTSQQFTLVDAWLSQTVWSGHEIELRARTSRTSFASDVRRASMSLSYRIPFSVAAPFSEGRSRRKVDVSFHSEDDGQPMVGVELMLGDRRFRTDDRGQVSIPVPDGADAWLLLSAATIGLDRLPLVEFPLLLSEDVVTAGVLSVGVAQAARLVVAVSSDGQTSAGTDAALAAELGSDAGAGRVVEARSGSRRVRRMTGRDGTVTFPPLLPGSWEVFLVGSTLPDGYVAQPDTLATRLMPGGSLRVELDMRPKRRSIQFVTSGQGLSLGIPTPVALPAADPVPESEAQNTVVVRLGDTLAGLGRTHYGSLFHWIRIWQANLHLIPDPSIILPGQQLVLPPPGPLTDAERQALLDRR